MPEADAFPAISYQPPIYNVSMRKGFDSLAAQAQTVLGQDPFFGHVFCFSRPPR
jgi:hypothetical protein